MLVCVLIIGIVNTFNIVMLVLLTFQEVWFAGVSQRPTKNAIEQLKRIQAEKNEWDISEENEVRKKGILEVWSYMGDDPVKFTLKER